MLRTNEEDLEITIGKKIISLKDYYTLFDENILSFQTIKDDIGYIFPGKLKEGEIDIIMNKFMNNKALIIDLRCYPSDFIVYSLSKYLLLSSREFAKFTFTSLDKLGTFNYTKPIKVGQNNNQNYFKGKVIILVNEETQSNAEFTVMALQASSNSITIGSQTAGADGNISKILLPGDIKTMISGIGVYYPNNVPTQRDGISIDIIVKPTIKDFIKIKILY